MTLSLRARILTIVIAGAIVPLGLLGVWLAASSARSGRELLRHELETSVNDVARRITQRWDNRAAELALLGNNEPARRALAIAGRPDPEATRYFEGLAAALRGSIREFRYRDTAGQVRWSSENTPVAPGPGGPGLRGVAGINEYDAVLIRRPVLDSAGRGIGSVEARVLLSALLPADSLQPIVAGAALHVINRSDGEEVGGLRGGQTGGLVSTRVSLEDPPLDLELAASDARFTEPFARAGRLGVLFLLGVAGLALALTAFLTRRLTGSLGQMVEAAGAVAAGDLERSVTGGGSAEVERLAEAFNTMTESLRRTLRELARGEALAAVGQFAASISHEVRNALTAIRLDLQRLGERVGPDDRVLVRRLLGNVRRLDSIVTGSLRIARSDPATMRPLLLEGVVRSAMTAAEPVFVERGATLALERGAGGADGLKVRGDAGALEHLLLNLLINAAQAVDAGGTARVAIERRNGRGVVRIADSGRGIPPEVQARIGERFFSLREEGTGLGFAIAREIALVHGGEIAVASTGPSGTDVELLLPVASPASPQ